MKPSAWEARVAAILFAATFTSVFFTYGWFWGGGDPVSDPGVRRDALVFAGALMAILLSHELAHYVVARRHGFSLSLPWFIPFPAAFGTFGAVIRLRSLPRSRTALLEMGAAGPIAGAVVAFACLAAGLGGTMPGPESLPPPLPAPDPGLLGGLLDALDAALSWGPLGWLLDHLATPVPRGRVPILVLNDPPVMDIIGRQVLGAAPGRFDMLTPLALAGWVGCFITALNLVPIGQLDGGHVLNALAPRAAPVVARVLLLVAFVAGFLSWGGWSVWALLLWWIGASRGLPVPERPGPSRRSRWVALAVAAIFALTFIPRPIEVDSLPAAVGGDTP